jgi:hypothetical protein
MIAMMRSFLIAFAGIGGLARESSYPVDITLSS